LICESDIISIHSPLNEKTKNLFNKETFIKMKNTSMLINTGRGGIINENDLCEAIEKKLIAGAALDVLSAEPMTTECAYIKILNYPNFIITPHIGWAAKEARERCISEICINIENFMNGISKNIS